MNKCAFGFMIALVLTSAKSVKAEVKQAICEYDSYDSISLVSCIPLKKIYEISDLKGIPIPVCLDWVTYTKGDPCYKKSDESPNTIMEIEVIPPHDGFTYPNEWLNINLPTGHINDYGKEKNGQLNNNWIEPTTTFPQPIMPVVKKKIQVIELPSNSSTWNFSLSHPNYQAPTNPTKTYMDYVGGNYGTISPSQPVYAPPSYETPGNWNYGNPSYPTNIPNSHDGYKTYPSYGGGQIMPNYNGVTNFLNK